MVAIANLIADFTPPGSKYNAVPHRVYTRTKWADDWQLASYLWCDAATFGLAPNIPTAELSWNYGRLIQPGTTDWAKYLPDEGHRRYVKIEWTVPFTIAGETKNLAWYGLVQSLTTLQGGVRTALFPGNTQPQTYESGKQRLLCVGLEKLLQDEVITSAYWQDGTTVKRIDRGLIFNAPRADGAAGGNRTSGPFETTHLFSGRVLDDDSFWEVKTILPYLLKYHPPKDKNDVAKIPFALHGDASQAFTGWSDKPIIPTHGRNLRDLLNQMLPRERLLTWWLDVNEETNTVEVHATTLTGEQTALPSNQYIPANPRRLELKTDVAQGHLARFLSHHEAVDRVLIRGSRGTATCTVSKPDGNIGAGWTSALETEYEQGATGTPAYTAAVLISTKQRLNSDARKRDKLAQVYSRFAIVDAWDGKAKNGENGGTAEYVFPLEAGDANRKFYNRELYVLATLPLRDGYDYSNLGSSTLPIAAVKVSDGPFNELPPLVYVPWTTPEGTKVWVSIEKWGGAAATESLPGELSRKWSGHVSVPEMDRSIVIRVHGEDQHIIAGTDFTPIAGVDANHGRSDWKEFIFTVAVEADYFCEGSYPPVGSLPDSDYLRVMHVAAPASYRLDWLVPNTVVGATKGGELIRSTGGWVNDDRQKLADRARMAYGWYGQPRSAIEFTTSLINGSLRPGDFVVSVGSAIKHTVNSVISHMRISQPPGTHKAKPPAPTITYATEFVEDIELF